MPSDRTVVATWGPVTGGGAMAALRVSGRIRAYYYAVGVRWRADTGVVTDHPEESGARAYIEEWARGKGWEVRDA